MASAQDLVGEASNDRFRLEVGIKAKSPITRAEAFAFRNKNILYNEGRVIKGIDLKVPLYPSYFFLKGGS